MNVNRFGENTKTRSRIVETHNKEKSYQVYDVRSSNKFSRNRESVNAVSSVARNNRIHVAKSKSKSKDSTKSKSKSKSKDVPENESSISPKFLTRTPQGSYPDPNHPGKVLICHNCNTLSVDPEGLNGHDGHIDDYDGPCIPEDCPTSPCTPCSPCEDSEDCAGVVNGTSILDCAGVCYDPEQEAPPNAPDCAGVCNGNSFLDCDGVCGGSATLDCAGVCGGSSTLDCAGICNGTSFLDCHGHCVHRPHEMRKRCRKCKMFRCICREESMSYDSCSRSQDSNSKSRSRDNSVCRRCHYRKCRCPDSHSKDSKSCSDSNSKSMDNSVCRRCHYRKCRCLNSHSKDSKSCSDSKSRSRDNSVCRRCHYRKCRCPNSRSQSKDSDSYDSCSKSRDPYRRRFKGRNKNFSKPNRPSKFLSKNE